MFPLWGPDTPDPRPEDLGNDCSSASVLAWKHAKGKTPHWFAPNGKDDATTDPAKITDWWSKRPQSAIGMRTDRLVVLDPDNAKGQARLVALEAEHGPLPKTRTVRTPGGGRHLLYRLPEGVSVGNGHKALGDPENLHVRGGGAGYIAAPPSETKLGRYRWECGKDGRLPPIAMAPAWLIELLTTNGHEQQRPPGQPKSAPSASTPYGQRALESEAAKVAATEKGARNNQLNESAFSLGQLVAGGELPEGEAEAVLLEAAQAAGLSQTEAMKTIRSGLSAGSQKPRSAPPRLHAVPGVDANAAEVQEDDPPIVIPTLRNFLQYDFPAAESLVGVPRDGTNLLPRYGWVLPWGPEGCGKTGIVIDGLIHGAAGIDWLGYPVSRPIRSVLVINEGVPGGLQDRLKQRAELWDGNDGWQDLIAVYAAPWGEFDLRKEGKLNHLRDFAHDFQADYCVLDPLFTIGPEGAGAPAETEAFKHRLRQLGVWETLGAITPHHANKAGMVSGDWGRHPDTLIRLEKDNARPVTKWTIQKARPCDPAEQGVLQQLEWITETMSYKRVPVTDSKAAGELNKTKVLDAAKEGHHTLSAIALTVDLSEKTVSKHLKKLEEEHQLTLGHGDKNTLTVTSLNTEHEAEAA